MLQIEHLEKRIEVIEERNKRVEADKAWPSLRIYGFAQTAYSAVSRAGYFGGQGDEWMQWIKKWWMRRRGD